MELGSHESPGREIKSREVELGSHVSPGREIKSSEVELGSHVSPGREIKSSEVELGSRSRSVQRTWRTGIFFMDSSQAMLRALICKYRMITPASRSLPFGKPFLERAAC